MDSTLIVIKGVVLTFLAFGLMIFVHELGHFLAAKLIRVRVDRFSFGFGWKLVGRKWGETEYMISAVPLGGYVKLAGGDEGEESTGAPDEFVSKTPGQRFIVFAAGPLFSILFGIPLAMAMLVIGRQTPASRVSYVAVGSPAWDAGVKYGDRIASLGSRHIATLEELQQATHECPYGEPLDLVVERDGKEVTLSVVRPKGRRLGVDCNFVYATVREVEAGTPAAAADIRKDDHILAVNGKRLRGWFDFRRHILPSADRAVELTLERDGAPLNVQATPRGIEAPDPGFSVRLPAEIGFVRKGFPADGKLRVGDRICAVNGKPVEGWWDIEDAVSEGPPSLAFAVERAEADEPLLIPIAGPQAAQALRAALDARTRRKLTVELPRDEGVLLADSLGIAPAPAYEVVAIHRQAAPPLQAGDRVVKVGNADLTKKLPERAVYTPLDEAASSLGSHTRKVKLTVRRRHMDVAALPQATLRGWVWAVGPLESETAVTIQPGTRSIGQLGVVSQGTEVMRKEGLLGSFVPAVQRTLSISTFAFKVIARLFQGDVPATDLMGPVGIAQVTYGAATRGWSDLFWLVHLITVNIGVFNLLPLPPLDGGRIVMLGYEKLRGKRPSRRVQEAIILAGFGLVVAVFLLATFNDFTRLFF